MADGTHSHLRNAARALAAGGFYPALEGRPHADITSDDGAVIYLHSASPNEHLL